MSVILKAPLNSIPYQNVSDFVLDNLSDELLDGYIDELGNTNKRPGLGLYTSLGTSKKVDGSFFWEAKALTVFVSDGRILTVDANKMINDITGDTLLTDGRPTFAENGSFLVIANGGLMVYTDGVALTISITDPQAPSLVTHVAFLDNYLLAFQKGTALVRFANFENIAPTSWNFDDFFTAESNPDGIVSLYTANGIVYIFGTSSIEFWINDGVSPFRRTATQRERGVMGPYSTVLVNDSFYFFDANRRLSVMNGFNAKTINTSFDKTIQSFPTVTDTLSDYVTVLGKNWIVFSFPDSDKTLMYDLQGPGTTYWSEWSTWDAITNTRKRFILNTYIYVRSLNVHLIGDYKGDSIFQLDETFFTDSDLAIRFLKRTGNIDYEVPYNSKTSYELIVRMLSGSGLADNPNIPPKARIRWRDNGDTTWSNYVDITLASQGDKRFLKRITANGSYYTRQYEISMTDNAPFIIGKSFERVDINEF